MTMTMKNNDAEFNNTDEGDIVQPDTRSFPTRHPHCTPPLIILELSTLYPSHHRRTLITVPPLSYNPRHCTPLVIL